MLKMRKNKTYCGRFTERIESFTIIPFKIEFVVFFECYLIGNNCAKKNKLSPCKQLVISIRQTNLSFAEFKIRIERNCYFGGYQKLISLKVKHTKTLMILVMSVILVNSFRMSRMFHFD